MSTCPCCGGTGRVADPKICEECSSLFTPRRSDALFCEACRKTAAQRRYKERLSPEMAAYRREYKRLDQMARRGSIARSVVDQWREQKP